MGEGKKQIVARHLLELRRCSACPEMIGPVVVGFPVASRIILVGQAPGVKEGEKGKPFAWTAGKTLFRWFAGIGIDEENFRKQVYMAAVCRCFPGKNPKGGDRVPGLDEINNCQYWLKEEFSLLRPRLVIPVGKLAIQQFYPLTKLDEVVGQCLPVQAFGMKTDMIALPHPSGASTWHRMEPGLSLLKRALQRLHLHKEWQALLKGTMKRPQCR